MKHIKKLLNIIFYRIQKKLYGNQINICPKETSYCK